MARKTANDDPLAPVTLAVGQEDLLLDRAVRDVVAAARAADADTDVRELTPDQLQPGTLAELVSPSLFAERKVVVVRNAQDLSADTIKDVKAYLAAPAEEITLVLLHAGGAKGKGLLDAARKAGAREVACPKMTKPADRLAFVRQEFRASGRSATPEACQALVDAIGSDLRELASAVSQLTADVEGTIDEAVVGRYYTGRAEASSFTVADRAVEGRAAEALEALRWSLATGVAPVMITSALAQGVRAIGKLSSACGGRPADLARELGMPPWKIDRVRQQMRGWTPDGVAVALRAVAEADAGVKGGGDDPEYALEKAVVTIARAARSRGRQAGGAENSEASAVHRRNDGEVAIGMAEHPYAALVRQGYEAFQQGDMDTLRSLMTGDCIHHVLGSSMPSGDHQGIDSIIDGCYARLAAETGGRVELQHVLVDGRGHAVSLHRATADRGGKHLDEMGGIVFRIIGDKITDLDEVLADIDDIDGFWS